MNTKKSCLIAGLVSGAILAFAAKLLYEQRSRERIPSAETLDDAQVIRAFSRISSLPQMALMRKMVLNRALNLCSLGHALDLGCGPGYLVAELARSSADLFVTGIDLSEQALIEARQRTVLASINDRVDLRYGDAVEVPLPDNTIDLVVSTLSLHHWNSPVDVFNEIKRVLRPGGSFVIFDLRRDMSTPFWLLIWFVSNVVVPEALKRIYEPMASRDAAYTPAEAQQLVSASKLTGWQVDAGPMWLFIEGRLDS